MVLEREVDHRSDRSEKGDRLLDQIVRGDGQRLLEYRGVAQDAGQEIAALPGVKKLQRQGLDLSIDSQLDALEYLDAAKGHQVGVEVACEAPHEKRRRQDGH